MRIAIVDVNNVTVGFMDSDTPKALQFYDERLHTYIDGSAHTFEFTANAEHPDAVLLKIGNRLSFVYNNKHYHMEIVDTSQDEDEITVTAYTIAFQLNYNRATLQDEAETVKTFEQHLNTILSPARLPIVKNETGSETRSFARENTGTYLGDILRLAEVFGAEVEFVPSLNNDYSLNRMELNVKRSTVEVRSDVSLRYGINIDTIKKKQDMKDMYTQVTPEGKDGLDISSLPLREVRDSNGRVAFRKPAGSGTIYAVQSAEMYPTVFTLPREYSLKTDLESAEELYTEALNALMEASTPKTTYDVSGFFDAQVGDNFLISDEEFNPPLSLIAKVVEQNISFSNPDQNKTTFETIAEVYTGGNT